MTLAFPALPFTALAVTLALVLTACGATPPPDSPEGGVAVETPHAGDVGSFSLVSADFADGGPLSPRFTANAFGQCEGENLNPELTWSGAPAETVAYAITMVDLDYSEYSHWVHVGLPASTESVDTGASAELPGIMGVNAPGTYGYFGPCPPSGAHRYLFTVYALDDNLAFDGDVDATAFARMADGHVLATATLTGVRTYGDSSAPDA